MLIVAYYSFLLREVW